MIAELLGGGACVSFTVWGEPQQKGSTRSFAIPIRNHPQGKYRAVTTSANPDLKVWSVEMRYTAKKAAGNVFFRGPVAVTLNFGFTRPKSVSLKKRPHHTVKPDLDKLVRAAIDTLTGVVFTDDSQVIEVQASKVYADGPAFTIVHVREHQAP